MAGNAVILAQLPELTGGRLLSSWQLDVPALLLVIVLGALYGWGMARLRRRGEPWPPGRAAAFALLGLGGLVVATMSGLAVYDHELFWPAAVQNILLDLVAPLGLALGDPLRLAVEALPEGSATRVRRLMTGRVVRTLTFPMVSTALVLATELTIYFTPYFATALRVGWLHELMYLHLLAAGSLVVVPVLTHEEALPAWCTHPVRAALVFLDGIVDAVPGVVVMTHGTLVAGAWYLHHAPSWSRCPSCWRSCTSGRAPNAPGPRPWTAGWTRNSPSSPQPLPAPTATGPEQTSPHRPGARPLSGYAPGGRRSRTTWPRASAARAGKDDAPGTERQSVEREPCRICPSRRRSPTAPWSCVCSVTTSGPCGTTSQPSRG